MPFPYNRTTSHSPLPTDTSEVANAGSCSACAIRIKTIPMDDHVITLVHCCWRESQSSRGLAVAPRAVGLLDTKGKPQIA